MTEAKEQVTKVKRSVKQVIKDEVTKLTPGQQFAVRLPGYQNVVPTRLGIIELNPKYPDKDKKCKYCVSLQDLKGDKPTGDKRFLISLKDPQHVAKWMDERFAQLLE